MLPQSPQALFTYDSVWEDLLDAARQGGQGDATDRAKAMAAKLELTDKLTSHPFDLSGGELQRAAHPGNYCSRMQTSCSWTNQQRAWTLT